MTFFYRKAKVSRFSSLFGNIPKISAVPDWENHVRNPNIVRYGRIPAFEESEHFAKDIWGNVYAIEVFSQFKEKKNQLEEKRKTS